jgi:ATP-dependent RNA helicase RhlE
MVFTYICTTMKFDDYRLSKEVKKNLGDMDFRRPTDIQYKCIPPIQRGEDLLAIAQTGTGKTAAFAIPVIDKIQQIKYKSKNKSSVIRSIVMVPTRELAQQITQVFNRIGKNTKVKALCVFGGVDQDHQINKLIEGMDIIVSTPGRMFDLVSQGYLKLDRIETLILDEADQMLDLGFAKDIDDLVRKLPRRRQTLFFSATINKKIKAQAYKMVSSKAIRIQISPENPVSKNVNHQVAFVEMDDKRFFLQRIIQENEGKKILIFVRTKVRAERVKKAMERAQIDTLTIHGDKEQQDRDVALLAFKTGACSVLIATDVTARGIDIDGVEMVINYDLPEISENYVHRVGRTGRGRNKGRAISFCAKEERDYLSAIEEFITVPIARATVTKREYEETVEFADDGANDWQKLMQESSSKTNKKTKKDRN